jgi:hypothetical protein
MESFIIVNDFEVSVFLQKTETSNGKFFIRTKSLKKTFSKNSVQRFGFGVQRFSFGFGVQSFSFGFGVQSFSFGFGVQSFSFGFGVQSFSFGFGMILESKALALVLALVSWY